MPTQARTVYKRAVFELMSLKMVDAVRALVEREEGANSDPSQLSAESHLLTDINACLAFALAVGTNRSVWWRLLSSLFYWWELHVAQAFVSASEVNFAARAGIAGTPYGVSATPSDDETQRLRDSLATYTSMRPKPPDNSMGWNYLRSLQTQVERLCELDALWRQPNTQERVRQAVEDYNKNHSPSELAELMSRFWTTAQVDVQWDVTWPEGSVQLPT